MKNDGKPETWSMSGADDLVLDESGLKVFDVKLFSPIFWFQFFGVLVLAILACF